MASFDEVIPPGQAGKVSAQLKTENYRGPVEKVITVTSSDSSRPSVSLRLKARIVGSVEVLPRPGLQFPAGVNFDYAGKLVIRKDETESGDLKVTDLTTTAPWLVATSRKVEQPEVLGEGLPAGQPGDYIIDVSVADDAPRTQGGFQVRFKTGLPREPEVTVPVSVVLQNAMRIVPTFLFLPPQREETTPATGVLTAMVRPGLSKEPLRATASPEAFSVRVEPDGPRKYKAMVTWTPKGPDTAKEGNVVFRLGEESTTVLVRVGDGKATFARPQPIPSSASK